MKSVTIRQVAARAGVAPSTVSRCLTGSSFTSEDMRRRVFRAADELMYVRREKRCVGVVWSGGLNGCYDPAMLFELGRAFRAAGCFVIFLTLAELPVLNRLRLDGIVLMTYSPRDYRMLTARYNLPVITINNYSMHLDGVYSVRADEAGAVREAVRRLRGAGHRRIGCLISEIDNYSNRRRRQFFADAAGGDGRVYPLMTPAALLAKELRRDGMTALIVPYEQNAANVLDCLRAEGVRVPEELSMIGWDVHLRYFEPRSSELTSCSQDYRAFAGEALRLFSSLTDSRAHAGRVADVVIPYVWREGRTVKAAGS